MDVRHNNNALQELNDCIRGLLHLGLNVITFRTLLHLGPNVITFRTLLHLGQLFHLGLQQPKQIRRMTASAPGKMNCRRYLHSINFLSAHSFKIVQTLKSS